MFKYIYNGPVFVFGKKVGTWTSETYARSPEKALVNLCHQYKRGHKMVNTVKMELDKKYLKEVI